MNDMKCPICGQELKNINLMWFCENESCRAYDWTMEEAAWQELIRTRKALDVAVDALKEISLSYQNGLDKPVAPAKWFSIATDMCDYADNAIEQITALEQKDK